MTADDQGLFRRDHDEPMAQSPKLDREVSFSLPSAEAYGFSHMQTGCPKG
jgi:hypothetical protein